MNYWYNNYFNGTVHRLAIFSILIILILSACQERESAPDVSHIKLDMEWVRYDSLFFEMDTQNIAESFRQLRSDYPAFTELYMRQILGLKDTVPVAKDLVVNDMLRTLYDSVKAEFEEMNEVRSSFEQALRYYKYYLPVYNTPAVYTCMTEFSVASFVFLDDNGKDALGVSLDMYLGKDFPYHKLGRGASGFSNYLTRTFNRDHIVKKTMQALVEDKLHPPKDERLIDHMVHNGKNLYILHRLMPDIADTVLFEYTPEELQWCRENELEIWSFIIDKDLLYNRSRTEINTLISPAPSSMGMPPESPGRTANFIGYQIVSEYMERMENMSLQELIDQTDAQKILTQSKYKPR